MERVKIDPKRLIMARKQKKLSQLDLAFDIDKYQHQISYLETGKRMPDLEFAKRLCRRLEVSIEFLQRKPNK